MVNPKLTLSSVLDEEQTCLGLLACQSFTRILWLKFIQTLTPAQTLVLDTTCMLDKHGLTAICHSSEDRLQFIGNKVRNNTDA
jgi:hypothetical protein